MCFIDSKRGNGAGRGRLTLGVDAGVLGILGEAGKFGREVRIQELSYGEDFQGVPCFKNFSRTAAGYAGKHGLCCT